MQLVDKKGRLFGKINILDLLIIFILILTLGGGYWYLNRNKNKSSKAYVYFTVELKNTPKGFGERIKEGDKIKDSVRDNYLGVVESVEISPDKFINWDKEQDAFITSYSEEEYTVLVKIRAESSKTNSDIFAQSFPIKVGKDLSIKGKGYAKSGYVVAMLYQEEGK